MKTIRLAALAITLIFGSALAQDQTQELQFKIVVAGDGADDATTIDWSSINSDIDLHNMQVGESQSIVDDTGRSILVTKEENGLRFDVDGKSVVMPDAMPQHGSTMALKLSGDIHEIDHDIDVEVLGSSHTMASPVTGGVMIVTREPLDAATQESIRSVLLSAGNSDEVTFINRGVADGQRRVHVIKKVEIQN